MTQLQELQEFRLTHKGFSDEAATFLSRKWVNKGGHELMVGYAIGGGEVEFDYYAEGEYYGDCLNYREEKKMMIDDGIPDDEADAKVDELADRMFECVMDRIERFLMSTEPFSFG